MEKLFPLHRNWIVDDTARTGNRNIPERSLEICRPINQFSYAALQPGKQISNFQRNLQLLLLMFSQQNSGYYAMYYG